MSGIQSPARHTPSVSEIQAALQAARQGAFAAPARSQTPAAAPSLPGEVDDLAVQVDDVPAGKTTPARPRRRKTLAVPMSAVSVASATEEHERKHRIWLIGVHSGSGARSLAAVLPGARLAEQGWPSDTAAPVVLVCRSNYRGLTAAQDQARAHRDDAGVQLRGVIVVADCPGRLPVPLRRLERLVSGAIPILGRVPWMPTWRLGPPDAAAPAPEWATTLSAALVTSS